MVTDSGKYNLAMEADSLFAEAGNSVVELDSRPITGADSSVIAEDNPAAEADKSPLKKKNEGTAEDSIEQEYNQLMADLKRLIKEREELRIKSLDLMQNNPRADNYSFEMTQKWKQLNEKIQEEIKEFSDSDKEKISGDELNHIVANINQLLAQLNHVLKNFIKRVNTPPAIPRFRNPIFDDGIMIKV